MADLKSGLLRSGSNNIILYIIYESTWVRAMASGRWAGSRASMRSNGSLTESGMRRMLMGCRRWRAAN